MKRFMDRQRIRIVRIADDRRLHDDETLAAAKEIEGRTGAVVRLRRLDDLAWVGMDEDLPAGVGRFPVGDVRARHLLLAPEECEELDLT